MRRISAWLLATVAALVLVFGYDARWRELAAGTVQVATAEGSDEAATAEQGDDEAATASRTVTGSVVQTRWGPVQVQITTDGDSILDVVVLQYPDSNHHDQEINAYALPILVAQTLEVQSAEVDMVSGATVTSEGYQQSLQAALDEAGL